MNVSDQVIPLDAAPVFDENEAAVIDTFVVPSYLKLYWEACRGMLLVGEASRVVHLEALTGYPVQEILTLMPNTTGVGVERSEACAQLAAGRTSPELFRYLVGESTDTGLEDHSFSHALLMHPLGSKTVRSALFSETARLLYGGGQALVSLPLSRSFPEVLDLIEEFSLKYDDADVTRALQLAAAGRVTVESVSEELENAGFSDIDFEIHNVSISYDSGRAFLEDPSVRYFVTPQVESWLDQLDLASAMEYVGRAIDKYWSEEKMELGVSIAAFSARR